MIFWLGLLLNFVYFKLPVMQQTFTWPVTGAVCSYAGSSKQCFQTGYHNTAFRFWGNDRFVSSGYSLILVYIGPCIIVIVEEWKTKLMSLAILFNFLCAQHVSDINKSIHISIIRSLRLFCWITTLVILFLVQCVLEFRCGWVGVVSVLQAEGWVGVVSVLQAEGWVGVVSVLQAEASALTLVV